MSSPGSLKRGAPAVGVESLSKKPRITGPQSAARVLLSLSKSRVLSSDAAAAHPTSEQKRKESSSKSEIIDLTGEDDFLQIKQAHVSILSELATHPVTLQAQSNLAESHSHSHSNSQSLVQARAIPGQGGLSLSSSVPVAPSLQPSQSKRAAGLQKKKQEQKAHYSPDETVELYITELEKDEGTFNSEDLKALAIRKPLRVEQKLNLLYRVLDLSISIKHRHVKTQDFFYRIFAYLNWSPNTSFNIGKDKLTIFALLLLKAGQGERGRYLVKQLFQISGFDPDQKIIWQGKTHSCLNWIRNKNVPNRKKQSEVFLGKVSVDLRLWEAKQFWAIYQQNMPFFSSGVPSPCGYDITPDFANLLEAWRSRYPDNHWEAIAKFASFLFKKYKGAYPKEIGDNELKMFLQDLSGLKYVSVYRALSAASRHERLPRPRL